MDGSSRCSPQGKRLFTSLGRGAAYLKQPQSGVICRPMRTFLAAFAAILTLAFAAGGAHAQNQAQAQAGVPEVERYVNSIRTLQARFVQNNPNGSVVQGTL